MLKLPCGNRMPRLTWKWECVIRDARIRLAESRLGMTGQIAGDNDAAKSGDSADRNSAGLDPVGAISSNDPQASQRASENNALSVEDQVDTLNRIKIFFDFSFFWP